MFSGRAANRSQTWQSNANGCIANWVLPHFTSATPVADPTVHAYRRVARMKFVFGAVVFLMSVLTFAQETSELSIPPNGDDERAEVSQWVGPVRISIEYHSPRVHHPATNDRTGHIWGELVHYGFFDEGFGPTKAAPWRAGANESTSITLSHDVKIGGKDVPAGTYALFLDVEKDGPWNWILSKHYYGWGSYQYDPKADVL